MNEFNKKPKFLTYQADKMENYLYEYVLSYNGKTSKYINNYFGWDNFDSKNIGSKYSGKAFRPSICILICTSLSGTLEMALPPSISVELVHNFSLIHCRSCISSLVGLRFKRMYAIPFLFDMRGFWADERIDGGLWNLKNPIYKIVYNYFKKKERQFLIHSDHTISLTHNGKKNIINHSIFYHLKKNISVIPCCTDLNLFKPVERDSNSFVIGYLGSLGTWYLLREMLVFFQKINEKIPDSKFHFLTKDNPDIIFDHCDYLGIDRKNILIEETDREDIPFKTRNWNFSLCFIKPSFSKIFSSPTKQGELMAMGIPIICNSGVGDVDFIVEKYKSGFVLKDLNKVNFKNILNSNFKKQKLIEGANQYFSLEKGVMSYLKIYQKIC